MNAIIRPLKQLLDAGFPVEHIKKEAEKQLVALEALSPSAEVDQAIEAVVDFIATLKGE